MVKVVTALLEAGAPKASRPPVQKWGAVGIAELEVNKADHKGNTVPPYMPSFFGLHAFKHVHAGAAVGCRDRLSLLYTIIYYYI